MKAPFFEEAQQHRRVMQRTEGTGVLAVKVQYFRNELVLIRPFEGADISGNGLIEELLATPGFDGLAAILAPPDAPWRERLQKLELALQTAAPMLHAASEEYSNASHELFHLREKQMEAINTEEYGDLHERVIETFEAIRETRHTLMPEQQRISAIEPTLSLIHTHSNIYQTTYAMSEPKRTGMRRSLWRTYDAGLVTVMEELGLPENVWAHEPDADLIEHGKELETKLAVLAEEVGAAIVRLEAEWAALEEKIEQWLG